MLHAFTGFTRYTTVNLTEVAELERGLKKGIVSSRARKAVNADRRGANRQNPIIPDVLCAGLDLVFCGTAPSRTSAASRAYYAHPGNAFWRMISEAGLTPRQLAAKDFRSVTQYGIGLTDLAKFHCGNDSELPLDAFDTVAFREKVLHHAPRWVAFTSKTAAQAYWGYALHFGYQPWRIGTTQVFVLPSPSGQARRTWNPALWLELADRARSL